MKKILDLLYLVFEPDEKRVDLFIARGRARSGGRDYTTKGNINFVLLVSTIAMLLLRLDLGQMFAVILILVFTMTQYRIKNIDWKLFFSDKRKFLWGIIAFLFAPFTFWNDSISNNLIAYPAGILLAYVIPQGFVIGYVLAYIGLTILGTHAVHKVVSVQHQDIISDLKDAVLWAFYSMALMVTLYYHYGWFSDIEEFARLFY